MLILAMALPWLCGAMLLRACWSDDVAGRGWLCVGYGYVLGSTVTALLLMLQGSLGLPLRVEGLLVLCGIGAIVGFKRMSPRHRKLPSVQWSSLKWPMRILLIWLGIRSLSLAIELVDNGLFGWDAWSTWAFRARVWVESGTLIPFVAPDPWLLDRSLDSMPLPAAHYPKLVSLIAAWPSLAFGAWNESIALMPWFFLYVALAFGVYGQCRLWGASPLVALITAWLISSVPLVGGQIALAGYADIWLSVTVGFAFMSFLLWVRDRDLRQGVLAVTLIAIGTFVKAEGLVWSGLFLFAFAAVWLRPQGWYWLSSASIGALLLLWVSGGLSFELPVLGLVELSLDRVSTASTGAFEFSRQQGVLYPLLVHLFVFDTWHLLMYVVLLAIIWRASLLPRLLTDQSREMVWERAALFWVLTACFAFYILFFWTSASEWVRLGTSVNRIMLHFAVALVFWLQCLWTTRIHARPSEA